MNHLVACVGNEPKIGPIVTSGRHIPILIHAFSALLLW
jgi:hypothetical protein